MTDTKPRKPASSPRTRPVRSPKTDLVLVDVSPDPVPSKPRDWEEIKVGSLVLAWDRSSETWYEAVVINVVDGACRLKWLEYPDEKPIVRRREQLALMNPDHLCAAT
jgi:hypothetical protein